MAPKDTYILIRSDSGVMIAGFADREVSQAKDCR